MLVISVFLLGCDATTMGLTGKPDLRGIPANVTEVSATDPADTQPDESGLHPETRNAIKNGPARTVAGLGDPLRRGLWLETPLVTTEMPGRVRVVSSGASAQVTLIPMAGPETGGSFLSLEAMQTLKTPLSDLIELEVSTSG